ncbi:YbaB/EbfC family DNA-binding protein [Mycolicibacterium sp. P1-18]|uniref:YbaB/EbfC family DNA-binding protein n=1 Tax=Mycolicibacterium sp. P1-18 TaxID=2024615 RepID=UPI0011F12B59|nr:YbaB/EbfC family DNA-binding protein [Mycolicibacterium sp. P1-18]KAA0099976.1 YbaB/EbfC family DNA-binding protein [Mycolicibacterium sp. P1-18]
MVDSGSNDSWDDEEDDVDDNTAWEPPGHLTSPGDAEVEVDDDADQAMFFTVTNPPGTVSVTALGNGMPIRVDLAPKVVEMTESQLTEEISVIAGLASRQAKAGQHLLVSSLMQRMGHDKVSVRSFVEYELGLPSVETVLAEKSEVFANRYTDEWH